MKRYSISNNGQFIDFEIIHRPAVTRRIHLEINENGELRVVAPRRMSRRSIHDTLQHRSAHVARFLVKARSRQQELPVYRYESGEQHPLMGQSFPLEIRRRAGHRASVELSAESINIILADADQVRVKSLLHGWYRAQARTHFAERLARFSQLAPWTAGQVPMMRLRLMKRTWGSCSSKGVITLNPHLVKAPLQCIDYVIAHEVCHLREHNHGRAFYEIQEQLFPGWRESKAHLHSKGHIYLHM